MRPDQKVYVSFSVNRKSNACMRPVAPATRSASPMLTSPGRPTTREIATATRPKTMTYICLTSVQVTACTPPSMV